MKNEKSVKSVENSNRVGHDFKRLLLYKRRGHVSIKTFLVPIDNNEPREIKIL